MSPCNENARTEHGRDSATGYIDPYSLTSVPMKTSVDISDSLFAEAKAAAQEEGTTLRALIEEGLRLVLERRCVEPQAELPDLRFGGNGLLGEFHNADWGKIRDASYDGRGS